MFDIQRTFSRTELLIGKENIENLKNKKIAIFGLGGVGSFVAEGISRCGIGNFILVKILRDDVTSQDLFDFCIQRGLMIRDCSTFPFLDNHYVRFCIMNPEQNDRLLEAFRSKLLG